MENSELMKKILEKSNLAKPLKKNDIVEGKIVGRKKAAVFLDLGALGAGVIYGREFYEAKDILRDLKIGDVLFSKVLEIENEDGYVELSLSKANQELAWQTLLKRKENEESFKVKILGANKGGLLAKVSGIPAFIPVSQLSQANYPKVEGSDNQKILKALQKFIGKELEIKIFALDPREQKLILSERAKDNEKIKDILKNYSVGNIIEGEITGVVEFGAFLKFLVEKNMGNEEGIPKYLEGLIHISELDWRLIDDPSKIVKVGQTVKAKIIDISKGKISLSLKALKQNPWEEIGTKYEKGSILQGEVTRINPFGAFVQISPEIQGLCHISEFGSQKKMKEALTTGEKYNFQVLAVEADDHKISLKLVEGDK